MRLSDLQDKDVIDLKTGEKVGNIIDLNINNDGKVEYFILEKKKFFINNGEINISFENISKIGEDVILIKNI